MAEFIQLQSPEELDRVFEASNRQRVLILKHSTTCPISTDVYSEVARADATVHLIVVQTARPLSNDVAERTGVRHESPQALILRNGEAVYHASHYDVTATEIERHLGIDG